MDNNWVLLYGIENDPDKSIYKMTVNRWTKYCNYRPPKIIAIVFYSEESQGKIFFLIMRKRRKKLEGEMFLHIAKGTWNL